MTNVRHLSPESEVTAQHCVVLGRRVATSPDLGAPQERIRSIESGNGSARGIQRSRRARRVLAHSNAAHDGLLDEIMAPEKIPLFSAMLWFGVDDG